MSDVVAKCDNEKITKVKVASAEIIVSGKADKPYYEIKYYDLSKNEWCIGYGSYELKFVFQWLNECIELAKEPQECNSDLISRKKLISDLFYSTDGNRYHTRDCDNFPITISLEDLRKVINNQPQVQPIDADYIIKQIEEQTSFIKGCTKYGNKDSEQQHKSYSTMMMYEVAEIVDDLIEIIRQSGKKVP